MFAEDLDALLADHGVACSSGGINFIGIKDEPDEDLSMGGLSAQSSMTTLLVKTSDVALASITSGSSIVVDGDTYKSRTPRRQDDGAFTLIPLSKP